MINPSDLILDHRARLERQQLEAAERREQALRDQQSLDNSPDLRVRIWERLHQVRLPKDPAHAILKQVAQQTRLAVADVQEIQRQRALTAQPAP